MSNTINLIEYLREIEDSTDLNGCFFINAENYKVLESTIPFAVPEEILWELSVLRDTFQQFGKGFHHGDLQELMIEGDRGYVLFYNIPPHLILLAMGKYDINLIYVKLAMIDILKNIREEIHNLGDEVLTLPAKGFGRIGMEAESSKPTPILVTAVPKSVVEEAPIPEPATIKESVPELEIQEEITPEPEELKVPISEPVIEATTSIEPVETPQAIPPSGAEGEMDISDLINTIKEATEDERYAILRKVFINLKDEIINISGVKLSEILELLKDAILEKIGTSLALFDISRTSREVSKNHNNLQPNEIEKYKDRIENWATRIIK